MPTKRGSKTRTTSIPPVKQRPGARKGNPAPSDRAVTTALTRWFAATRRDLPWRTSPGTPRDPYHVLVSETMLQQTQVSRVIERYTAFIARFPTLRSLSEADIDDVTALWSGLGYYRRARNLHAAARHCVEHFGAKVPDTVETLLTLPGVGRYTAGAIASIAHCQPAPAVDGNIQRVLLRLHAVTDPPNSKQTQAWLWNRAEELVAAAKHPGEWTEALMELGATVCTPRSPSCKACPFANRCEARAEGMQSAIPAPKPRKAPTILHHAAALTRNRDGHILLEQRPAHGMWAGLWQLPTLESDEKPPTPTQLRKAVGAAISTLLSEFDFQTTHRTVRVRVHAVPAVAAPKRGRYFSSAELSTLGISNLTKRILVENDPRAQSGGVEGLDRKTKR